MTKKTGSDSETKAVHHVKPMDLLVKYRNYSDRLTPAQCHRLRKSAARQLSRALRQRGAVKKTALIKLADAAEKIPGLSIVLSEDGKTATLTRKATHVPQEEQAGTPADAAVNPGTSPSAAVPGPAAIRSEPLRLWSGRGVPRNKYAAPSGQRRVRGEGDLYHPAQVRRDTG